MNRYSLFLLIILLIFNRIRAQTNINGRIEILTTIETLFEKMHESDSTGLMDIFIPGATISTVEFTNNQPVKKMTAASEFIEAISGFPKRVYDERIGEFEVTLSGDYAVVTMDYSFYSGDVINHCGIDVFEMVCTQQGWKIMSITDTRNTTDCVAVPKNSLVVREKMNHDTAMVHRFLDDWHHAAASADEDLFFGAMDDNGFYLGTDAKECWLKKDFYLWGVKYFERQSAWDFKPLSRNIHFSEDGGIAWFNELLDTWMGVCRGSGILHVTVTGWKIDQYHLSVTVPNEKTEQFIRLIK